MMASWVTIFFSIVLFLGHELYSGRQNLIKKIDTLANVAGYNLVAPLTFGDRQSAEEILKALKTERHILSAAFSVPTAACLQITPTAPRFPDFPLRITNRIRMPIPKSYRP